MRAVLAIATELLPVEEREMAFFVEENLGWLGKAVDAFDNTPKALREAAKAYWEPCLPAEHPRQAGFRAWRREAE